MVGADPRWGRWTSHGQRESHDKLASLARPGTRCRDRAGVQANQAPHEAQPDTEASRGPTARRIAVAEWIEDPVEPRCRDAYPRVSDAQDSLPAFAPHRHADPAIG